MIALDDTNVRHFKLSSGEDIIALVVEANKESSMLTLEHPMRIHITISDTGYKFMFSDWQPMAKNSVCLINPMHIISHVECANDIKERYIRMCIENAISSNTDNVATDEDNNDDLEDNDEFNEHYDSVISNNDGPNGSDPIH